ncbi:hypothetical protein O0L34_g11274 [Tuta absoluta]|nr:hypothetical protein O0L34_g11274 [Tuta absoluta]
MDIKIVLVCILVLFLKPETCVRNFASSADMEMLLKTEEEIIKSLKSYMKAEKKRLNYLEKYVARLKQEYEIAIKDIPYYLGNPINAYTIIKRLGPDLVTAEQILRNKTDLKPPEAVYPTGEDIKNSILGVVGLLSVYGLDVTQVANGIFNNTDRTPMTASDCYSIGMALYVDEEYHAAIPWFEEALNKLEGKHCDICPVDIIDVIDHISKCYHEIENIEKFIEWSEKRIFLRPKDYESMVQAKYLDALRQKENVREKNAKKSKSSFETNRQDTVNLTNICLGRRERNKTANFMNLSCYYAHGPHPVLILAPLKAELLHHDPDITMFYEVVSQEEIDDLQRISTPLLWENTESDLAEYRNAEAVILDDRAFPVAGRVSRLCLALSGLSAEGSENLKVVSYGIGGCYLTRWDIPPRSRSKPHDTDWDKHGTIIIYLTDVEQGGATIFPLLDLSIFPRKGAAVFWMNVLPSGVVDILTQHGACPIVRGTKWIAVKWPHYFNNHWCPAWYRNHKPVTTDMYKKILEERTYKYCSLKGIDKNKSLKNRQY